MTTVESMAKGDIRDPSLAEEGVRRIEWAEREMPVMRTIRERFKKDQPLKGVVDGTLERAAGNVGAVHAVSIQRFLHVAH